MYPSKIWHPWHYVLYIQFWFYDWIPWFYLRFLHHGNHRALLTLCQLSYLCLFLLFIMNLWRNIWGRIDTLKKPNSESSLLSFERATNTIDCHRILSADHRRHRKLQDASNPSKPSVWALAGKNHNAHCLSLNQWQTSLTNYRALEYFAVGCTNALLESRHIID